MSAHSSPQTRPRSPSADDWDALATSRDGLAVHAVTLDAAGEINEIACNNDGDGWTLVDGAATETHRLCRSCLKAAVGTTSPLATPEPLPVVGVEMVSAFSVRLTDERSDR